MYNYLIIFCFTLFYTSVFYPRNSFGDTAKFDLERHIGFLTLFHNLWFKGRFSILWDFDFHRTIPTVYLLMLSLIHI